jgi:hypothetical protein
MSRARIVVPGVAALLCLMAWFPQTSAGAGWRVDTFPELGSTGIFFSVDCPAKNLCVAAGSDDAIAASTEPAAGIGHWRLGHLQEPGAYTAPVAEGGAEVRLPGAQIRAVSCPTTSFCVAVTRLGSIFTSDDPAGGVATWAGFQLQSGGPRAHLYGLSCPTAQLCVAVGLDGKIVTSSNPSGGPTAWSTTQLPEPLELHSVSCPTAERCLAVGAGGVIVSSSEPTNGPAAWQVRHEPAFGELLGVSCPDAGLCLSGNLGSILTAQGPAAEAGTFASTSAPVPLQLTAFDCATEVACAAVNNNADVLTSTDPAGGGQEWAATNVVPFNEPNGTFGISCPTVNLCVAVGTRYLIAASTEPFGSSTVPGGSSSLRRPTVKITHHPSRVVRTGRKRVRVSFRFREIGLRDGFLCKLDSMRFHPCRSPVRFRVGRGRHLFSVKVADPGGLDQTSTRFRFRVIQRHRPQGRGSVSSSRASSSPR